MALSHRGLECRWSRITQSQPLRKIPGNFLITLSLNVNHFLYGCANAENMSLVVHLHINMHLRKKGKKVSSAPKMLIDLLKQYMRNKMRGSLPLLF